MPTRLCIAAAAGAAVLALCGPAFAADLCQGYGPQTPRDITSRDGTNRRIFTLAPPYRKMNLCNLHFHANAEHKGPGFSRFAGAGEHGGYQCNDTSGLTAAQLKPPAHDVCHGLKPGETIEVHWVYSTCDVQPGEGLGACLSDKCANPELRVESAVFLVVNDPAALDFADFTYGGTRVDGLYQAKALPNDLGDAVVFRGSTTGPKYSEAKCSPLQVTWSVRPQCARVDINSLEKWCEGNVFKEDHAHGVRALVTAPALLSKIE